MRSVYTLLITILLWENTIALLECYNRANMTMEFAENSTLQYDKVCNKAEYCLTAAIHGKATIQSPRQRAGIANGNFASCAGQDPFTVDCSSLGLGCHQLNELNIGTEGQKLVGNLTVCCCNDDDFCNGKIQTSQKNKLKCDNSGDLEITFAETTQLSFRKTCLRADHCARVDIHGEATIESTNQRSGKAKGFLAGCSLGEPFRLNCANLEPGCHKVSEVAIGEEGQRLIGDMSFCCCNDTDYCNRRAPTANRCHQQIDVSQLVDGKYEPLIPNNDEAPNWCYSPEMQCVNVEIPQNTTLHRREGNALMKGTIRTCSKSVPFKIDCSDLGTDCYQFKQLALGVEGQRLEGNIRVCCCQNEMCN